MHRGYLKLWRKVAAWEWSTDPVTFYVFIRMLVKANWTKKQWRGVTVDAGQFISSRAHLAQELCLSQRAIRTALTKLKTTGEVTSQSTSEYTVYTIVKYKDYQSDEEKATNETTSQASGERPASDQRATTTKELKALKKEKNTKRTSPQDSRITLIKNYFASRYMQHTNAAYLSAHARDGALIKSSLEAYDQALSPPNPHDGGLAPLSPCAGAVEHFQGLIDRFFDPEHLYKGNCDIPSFFKAMNRLQQPRSGNDSTMVDMSIFERNEP